MLKIRLRTLVLLACMLETAWLLLAQTLGNSILLWPCLACFLVLVCWAAIKGMAIPVLMFFLPFAALLKTAPGQTSFYTIALLLVYTICMFIGRQKISLIYVAPAIILIAGSLIVKTIYGYEIDNSYLLFAFSLMLTPFVANELGKKYDFYWLTFAFTLGIVVAALSSLYLLRFQTIARYIRNFELLGVVRHAGYYGDPNFYSVHISSALAGVLVLLLTNKSKARMIKLVLMAMALIYCGFLAVSKTFFLVVICLLALFLLELMFQRGKMSLKLLLLLTVVTGAVFLLSSTAFTKLFDMMIYRFAGGNNLSDFTTGRTEIWEWFYNLFKNDTVLLIFGNGGTDITQTAMSAHNTVIQGIYQFGIIGFILLLIWMACCVRIYLTKTDIKRTSFAQVSIILVGTIGPWMALDMLFFDEFFLMPMYICMGIAFISNADYKQPLKIRKGKYRRYEKRSR